MWVAVTTSRLGFKSPPPFGSVFWATPADDPPAKKTRLPDKWQDEHDDEYCGGLRFTSLGADYDRLGAVWITFDGQRVKLFRHEFNQLTMVDEMLSEPGLYEFVPHDGDDGTDSVFEILLDSDREVMEAAMLDGATREQAVQVMLGKDPSESGQWDTNGWYRLCLGPVVVNSDEGLLVRA